MTREFPVSNLSQTLKSLPRVCSYAGTLLSEERNTNVTLDAMYMMHRKWLKSTALIDIDSNQN